jgi:hypothetical protein
MPHTKPKPAAPKADRKPATQEKGAHPPVPAPDWVNVTPDDVEYRLNMASTADGELQALDLSRAEFILVKRILAVSRGYAVGLMAPLDKWQVRQDGSKGRNIRQEEIQMLMTLNDVVGRLIVNFRLRLRDGATVENGPWTLQDEGPETVDEYAQKLDLDCPGLSRDGLNMAYKAQADAAA